MGYTVVLTVGVVWMQRQADDTILPPTLERLAHAAQLPLHSIAFFTRGAFGAGVTGERCRGTTAAAPKVVVTVDVTVTGTMG